MDPAAGSSSEPILVENIPAQENLVDNQVALLPEDNQRQQSSDVIAPNVNVVPPAKRKLDFSGMDEDCGPAIAPAPSSTINDEDLNQSLTGVEHLEDEDDTAITDFAIVGREGNMQPLPFIESYVTTTASGGDFSKSPYNMTRVVLPEIDSPDISAFINGSFFYYYYF